jgi:co-chaperonin GroES (HSP10)
MSINRTIDQIRPLRGRVIVRTSLEGGLDRKIASIIIPDTAFFVDREDCGEVVAVGDAVNDCKIGDYVYFDWRHPGTQKLELKDALYVVLPPEQRLAVQAIMSNYDVPEENQALV